jgi:hypothetical protein
MACEEHEANAALWEHLSDEQIMELHQRILASVPAADARRYFEGLLRVVNPPERAEMLRRAPAHVAAPAA